MPSLTRNLLFFLTTHHHTILPVAAVFVMSYTRGKITALEDRTNDSSLIRNPIADALSNRIPRKRTAQDMAEEDRKRNLSVIWIQQRDRQVKRQRTDSQQLCWQFQRVGFCTNINCRFLHKDNYAPIKRNDTCKFWLQNDCRFGDRCWYLHSLQCEVIRATPREREEQQPSTPFISLSAEESPCASSSVPVKVVFISSESSNQSPLRL